MSLAVRYLHRLSAITWIGGMLFIALVLIPGLVVLALILSALHDFVLGPRAGLPGAAPAARVHASWVARLNVLVVLAIAALGLALRG